MNVILPILLGFDLHLNFLDPTSMSDHIGSMLALFEIFKYLNKEHHLQRRPVSVINFMPSFYEEFLTSHAQWDFCMLKKQ